MGQAPEEPWAEEQTNTVEVTGFEPVAPTLRTYRGNVENRCARRASKLEPRVLHRISVLHFHDMLNSIGMEVRGSVARLWPRFVGLREARFAYP